MRRAAAGTGFNPLNITNLKLWYDISDIGTVGTSGSNITSVSDKSTTGNALICEVLRNPTVSSLSGRQCALLNGITQGFVTTSNVTMTKGSYLIALKYEATPVGAHDIIVHQNAPFNELYLSGAGINTYSGANNNHSTDLDTSVHVLTVVFGASDVKAYVDGTITAANGSNVSGSALNDTISIGYYKNAAVNFSNMKVGEIIVVDGTITESDRVRAQNYLRLKWATP